MPQAYARSGQLAHLSLGTGPHGTFGKILLCLEDTQMKRTVRFSQDSLCPLLLELTLWSIRKSKLLNRTCFLPIEFGLKLSVLYPKFPQAYQPTSGVRAGPTKGNVMMITGSWPSWPTKTWTHYHKPFQEYRIPRGSSSVLTQSSLWPPLSCGLPHGVCGVLLYISLCRAQTHGLQILP